MASPERRNSFASRHRIDLFPVPTRVVYEAAVMQTETEWSCIVESGRQARWLCRRDNKDVMRCRRGNDAGGRPNLDVWVFEDGCSDA
jgi:hypothetical protein